MSLGEFWFGAATLAGSAGLTLSPVRKEVIKGSSWMLKEKEHLQFPGPQSTTISYLPHPPPSVVPHPMTYQVGHFKLG